MRTTVVPVHLTEREANLREEVPARVIVAGKTAASAKSAGILISASQELLREAADRGNFLVDDLRHSAKRVYRTFRRSAKAVCCEQSSIFSGKTDRLLQNENGVSVEFERQFIRFNPLRGVKESQSFSAWKLGKIHNKTPSPPFPPGTS